MAVKLLMNWDIAPEHDQEYFEFVIGEWIPGIQRMGLEPIEAWATIYGEYPQIQVVLLAADLPEAQRVLNSPEWIQLRNQLFAFVRNYTYKIVTARTGFQFNLSNLYHRFHRLAQINQTSAKICEICGSFKS